MRSFTSRAPQPRYAACLLLAYALVISLFVPFANKSVAAHSAESWSTKKTATSPSTRLMSPQRGGRHEGEVLVRFRGTASEREKDNIVLSHGARRNKKLSAESGIEKLELSAGQDVDTVAAQMRLNPAVELVEPNFLIRQDQLQGQPLDTNFTFGMPSPGRGGAFPSRSSWTSSGVTSSNVTA